MRIGIISDTHGDQAAIRQILKVITDVDLWLHAGDCSQDAEYLATLTAVPVTAVRGNCDGHTAAKIDEFIEADGRKIWLTHGHRYHVKQGTQEIAEWGKQYGMDVVVYGHSHVADQHWYEGIFIFNPGSAYGSNATCGVLEIDHGGKIIGTIVKVNHQ